MSEENETIAMPELQPEIAALDEKIVAAHQDDLGDSEKQALNAMIDERNAAFLESQPKAEIVGGSES